MISGKTLFTACFTLLCLGCEQKPADQPITCSDPQTTATVQKLFLQAVTDGLPVDAGAKTAIADRVKASFKITLDGIRTAARDESISKFTCDAELMVQPPPSVLQALAGNPLAQPLLRESGIKLTTDGFVASVHYTSQPTDDKKQFYVQLSGHGPLAEVAGIAAASTQVDGVTADATGAQAPTPVATVPEPAASAAAAKAEEDPICEGLDTAVVQDQTECLDRKYKAADLALNDTYKSLMSSLPEDRKASLRTEQRAWVAEKAKACANAGKEFSGGQMEAVVQLDCQVQQTDSRLQYLKRFK